MLRGNGRFPNRHYRLSPLYLPATIDISRTNSGSYTGSRRWILSRHRKTAAQNTSGLNCDRLPAYWELEKV